MPDGENNSNISAEIAATIRKQAIADFSKWMIGGLIALLGFALAGWWLYIKPQLVDIVGGAPAGAVLAFDRSDLDENECPFGWSPFLHARGRMIVGAGDPSKAPGKMAFDENGKPLKTYVLRQHGGEEMHLLSTSEIPPHTHGIIANFHVWDGGTALDSTTGAGRPVGSPPLRTDSGDAGGQPHNNMPPYVALYYCKKD